MNSHIFHIISFNLFLSNSYLIFNFICLTLSFADTHGVAKYARTYIQRYTHTHTHTQRRGEVGREEREKEEKKKKKGKEKKGGKRKEVGGMGCREVEERGY